MLDPPRVRSTRPGHRTRVAAAAAAGLALALLLSSSGVRSPSAKAAGDPPPDFTATGAFPPGFLFGVATSSHQVEGGGSESDWAAFERRADVADSGEADRHLDLDVLDGDLELARSLGVNAYRFSIDWSRVEPSRDAFSEAAIRHYQSVVDHVRARGMVPLVGLTHITLPRWVLDPDDVVGAPGWTSGGTVQQFVEYAARMAEALGGRVDAWTTFNEPNGQVAGGYLAGTWSPGVSGRWDSYLQATNNIILAHRRAYRALKQRDTIDADGDGHAAVVGLVQNMNVVFPQVPGGDDDQDARDWDYVFHKQVLDAVARVYDLGAFPVPAYARGSRSPGLNCWDADVDYACDVLPSTADGFLDFIGINYHNTAVSARSLLGAANPPLGDRSTGGIRYSVLMTNGRQGRPASDYPGETFVRGPWEIYPEGLLSVLRDLGGRYRLPMLVTENGLAEIGAHGRQPGVSKRPASIVSHLQMVLQATREGVPVRGYFHWSLVDNFEWRDAYDTRAKFGLFHVRHNREEIPPLRAGQYVTPIASKELDPAVAEYQQRTETPGAAAYRDLATARAITDEALDRWGSFPRLLGDRTIASAVRTIQANPPFASPGDPRTEAEEVVAQAIPDGCRIIDAGVMFTDESGIALAQTVNLRQGGRVADTRSAPARRVEIRAAGLGTADGAVSVFWSRAGVAVGDPPGVWLPPFTYRVYYRLLCEG
jgi:beta-glucosidase